MKNIYNFRELFMDEIRLIVREQIVSYIALAKNIVLKFK